MSWNGTVRCGHCYGQGHNKRGCPSRKQYAAENPDSYVAKQMASAKERNQNRRCSYCGKKGHNRRGCVEFKARMRDDIFANKKYRRLFVKEVKRLGIGPGALIVDSKSNGLDSSDVVYQVLAIHWDALTHYIKDDRYADPRFLEVCPVSDLMTRRARRHVTFTNDVSSRFVKEIKDMDDPNASYYNGTWRLASPATSSFTPPAGWVDDEAPIRKRLKDAESPDAWDNRHNS